MVEEVAMTCGLPINGISVVTEYLCLEVKVKLLLSKACASFCGECLDVCCRQEICSESMDSNWLRIVWGMCGHEASEYDHHEGWLSSNGCVLVAGRPPFCYAFMCNKIREHVTKRFYLSYLQTVSNLPSFVGDNAIGSRHLITLSSDEIKFRVNFSRLGKRVAKCHEIFALCEKRLSFFNII